MKLVVNRKPPKPKKPKPCTVRNVLAECLARCGEMTDVLVVGQHRDGTTRLGWSSQKNSDLLWLAEYAAHHLKHDLFAAPHSPPPERNRP